MRLDMTPSRRRVASTFCHRSWDILYRFLLVASRCVCNRGSRVVMIPVPSIVVYKGSRSQDRPESPTVVVRGGMPSLPSSRQGLAVSGSGGGAPHQDASESDMIDGNANPNAGTSPAPNSLHRSAPSCPPPDKSDTENKNFRNRVCVRA
jgi:hypothetical protein